MGLDGKYQVTRYSEAKDGAILVTAVGGQYVYRGMKAFSEDKEQGRRVGFFVNFGPFIDSDGAVPSVYNAPQDTSTPVIDISAACRFRPSLAPEDILPKLPANEECPGLVFLGEKSSFLGVRRPLAPKKWVCIFVNLVSGKLSENLKSDAFLATRRWSLVSGDAGEYRTSLFDYPPPPPPPKPEPD